MIKHQDRVVLAGEGGVRVVREGMPLDGKHLFRNRLAQKYFDKMRNKKNLEDYDVDEFFFTFYFNDGTMLSFSREQFLAEAKYRENLKKEHESSRKFRKKLELEKYGINDSAPSAKKCLAISKSNGVKAIKPKAKANEKTAKLKERIEKLKWLCDNTEFDNPIDEVDLDELTASDARLLIDGLLDLEDISRISKDLLSLDFYIYQEALMKIHDVLEKYESGCMDHILKAFKYRDVEDFEDISQLVDGKQIIDKYDDICVDFLMIHPFDKDRVIVLIRNFWHITTRNITDMINTESCVGVYNDGHTDSKEVEQRKSEAKAKVEKFFENTDNRKRNVFI